MFKGLTLKKWKQPKNSNIGIIKLPDIHTMEHQAESKMRNLATDMKWCPKYIIKWQTQTIVHVLVNVYVRKTLWKMVKVAASGQLNDRRDNRQGHLIQTLLRPEPLK